MTEIEKLKNRLKNAGKNVAEYRMTITEAKNLLAEIETLEVSLDAKVPTTEEPPAVIYTSIDGGSF